MFAVKPLEPLKVVEFTVTPPGSVVPVMNHWALAPFLNPLPLMLTPLYSLARKLPWTREAARRLGLVTHAQMIGTLVEAIEHPPDDVTGPRVWEVPRISQGRAP